MPAKKEEVRVFLEGPYLMQIDELLGVLGNTRSEVVAYIIKTWFIEHANEYEQLRKRREEAEKKGYL